MDSNIRVKAYTKELIIKHSKRLKLTQNDLVYKSILVAEKCNFEEDLPINIIEKNTVKQTNRMIGFLKTQDKNLLQVQENILKVLNSKSFDKNEFLKDVFLSFKEDIEDTIRDFYIERFGTEDLQKVENSTLKLSKAFEDDFLPNLYHKALIKLIEN